MNLFSLELNFLSVNKLNHIEFEKDENKENQILRKKIYFAEKSRSIKCLSSKRSAEKCYNTKSNW